MKCPRTNTPLKPIKVGGIEVDTSEGCGGVWLDNFELKKLTSSDSFPAEVLVEHLKQYHLPLGNTGHRLNCPKDTDVVMMRRFYSAKNQIEIDECPACGGVWLDAEELGGIINLFESEEDFRRTQQQFADSVMESDEIKSHEKEHDEIVSKLDKVGRILRSISKYVRIHG